MNTKTPNTLSGEAARNASAWNQVLAELENVPAEDARWGSVDEFVERIRAIAARKIDQMRYARELEGRLGVLSGHPKRPKWVTLPQLATLDIAVLAQFDDVSKTLLCLIDERTAQETQLRRGTAEDDVRIYGELLRLSQSTLDCWTRLAHLNSGAAEERSTEQSGSTLDTTQLPEAGRPLSEIVVPAAIFDEPASRQHSGAPVNTTTPGIRVEGSLGESHIPSGATDKVQPQENSSGSESTIDRPQRPCELGAPSNGPEQIEGPASVEPSEQRQPEDENVPDVDVQPQPLEISPAETAPEPRRCEAGTVTRAQLQPAVAMRVEDPRMADETHGRAAGAKSLTPPDPVENVSPLQIEPSPAPASTDAPQDSEQSAQPEPILGPEEIWTSHQADPRNALGGAGDAVAQQAPAGVEPRQARTEAKTQGGIGENVTAAEERDLKPQLRAMAATVPARDRPTAEKFVRPRSGPEPVVSAGGTPASSSGLREAAQAVVTTPADLGLRRRLLNEFNGEGYWAEAYWLAFSLATDPSSPDEIRIEAGTSEALLDSLLTVLSLQESRSSLEILHQTRCDLRHEADRVLAFVIALAGYAPSLAHPLKTWLTYYPQDSPALQEVAKELKSLQVEVPISREDVLVCSSLEAKQKERDQAKAWLKSWSENIPVHADWGVWTKLTKHEPRPVARMVLDTLKAKSDTSAEHIAHVQRMLDPSVAKALVAQHDNAGYRQMHTSMLRNLVGEITEIAERCHKYLILNREIESGMRSLTPELAKLAQTRKLLADRCEAAVTEIGLRIDASEDLDVKAAWNAGLRLWQWLIAILQINVAPESPSPIGKSRYQYRNAPLVLYPLGRDDAGDLDCQTLEDSQKVALTLAQEFLSPPTTGSLIERIAETGDYRFLGDLAVVERPDVDCEAAHGELEKRLAQTRKCITLDRARMEVAVARAWALGFATESQRSRFETSLGDIKEQEDCILGVRPAQRELAGIESELRKLEEQRAHALSAELDRFVERLQSRGVDQNAVAMVQSRRRAIEGSNWDVASKNSGMADLVETAQRAITMESIEDIASLLAGVTITQLAPAHLAALRSTAPPHTPSWDILWNGVQASIKIGMSSFGKQVRDLLTPLGITQSLGTQADHLHSYGESVTAGFCGVVEVQPPDNSPIPQFGSGLTHLIVAIDGAANGDLKPALAEIDKLSTKTPAIIFHKGELTEEQKWVRRLARGVGADTPFRTVVVVDRRLWTYLGSLERAQRLNALLQCALPYTYVNPFRAFGYVSKELFVGRDAEVRAITGGRSCLIYGGRQLGKSAILQEVARQLDGRETIGTRCLSIDLRDKFRTRPPEYIWAEIRRAFSEKIKPKASGHASAETTIKLIKDWLAENRRNQLIVLADEADSFLKTDGRLGYEESSRIAALMTETEGRFRIVFAGNKDVKRTAAGNAPLNEFGAPVQVMPTAPREARQILEKPLTALGISVSESDMYQILGRTNYYPGLIQFVGEKIVDRAARRQETPPVVLPSDQIGQLLEEPTVKSMMRERFGLTLGVSKEYKCVIYCLIQLRRSAVFDTSPSSIDQLLNAARKAWPRNFNGRSRDEFRVLLQELVTLGVLVADGEGFRLRSPNLVPLLGTPQELAAGLKEFELLAADESGAEGFHVLYNKEVRRLSPLSFGQEMVITGGPNRVSMVLTHDARQWNEVTQSLHSHQDEQFEFIAEIPADMLRDYDAWYAAFNIAERTKAQRITLYAKLEDLGPEEIRRVLERLQPEAQLSRQRIVTIVAGLPGLSGLHYFLLASANRSALESSRSLVSVRRWSVDQIRVALDDLEFGTSSAVSQEIHAATHGWHFLVNALFAEWNDKVSGEENIQRFHSRLNASLGQQFLNSLAIFSEKALRQTAGLLYFGGYSKEELTADRLNKDAPGLVSGYRCPPDLNSLLEYLVRIDVAQVVESKVQIDDLVGGLCTAEFQ